MNRIRRRKTLEVVLLLSFLLLATALRVAFVDSEPLWVDEAESSINALTILERGYPADHYLGLPIYENTLLTTWPDSEEYEFKDSSYSDRGMAIYHGWLPLYSIAAAYALSGIHPDRDDAAPPTVRHDTQELIRRTVVPRLPSILFAALFLGCIYSLGRRVSGDDTAWSVLVAAACAKQMVWFGWQARYYSATLAFSALTGLAVWNLTRRGRWRDAVATGLALVLVFYTHALSFFILTAVLVANGPFILKQPRCLAKLGLTGAVVALGIVPWVFWTGFFNRAVAIPSAWPLLEFPKDFFSYFATRKVFMGIIVLGSALAFVPILSRHQRFSRFAMTAAADRPAFYFAGTWFVIAYVGFLFLIPAASFWSIGLALVLAVPGYLLLALCITAASRAVTPRFTVLVSPLLMLVVLGVNGTADFQFSRPHPWNETRDLVELVELVKSWKLEADTKLYTWPNKNLVLTYYLGLPVQSVAPVRKSFLDKYSGDMILFEMGRPYAELTVEELRAISKESGTELSAEEVRQVSRRVQRHGARQYLEGQVANLWPPAEPMGEIELRFLEHHKALTRRAIAQTVADFPLLRGFAPLSMMDNRWLPVFYRFVHPEERLGDQLNYRDRIRSATGIVLPNGWIIFDCRRNREVPLVAREQFVAPQRPLAQ